MGRIGIFPDLGGNAPAQVDPREQRESHTVYLMTTTYARSEGKLQIPVMGDDDAESVVVKLCAPWGLKYVQWVACRNRLLPECPDMDTPDPNEVLAGWMVSPVAPGLKIDGQTYEFRIEGVYAYYLKKPPGKKRGLPMGRRPYDRAAGQTLRAVNFSRHHRG